jgi:hypothetical protein
MLVANSLTYYDTATITAVKGFIVLAPGANVIKLFSVVIYPHLMVLLSSCVIKLHYYGKYHRMAVNNPDKKFYNIGPRWQT